MCSISAYNSILDAVYFLKISNCQMFNFALAQSFDSVHRFCNRSAVTFSFIVSSITRIKIASHAIRFEFAYGKATEQKEMRLNMDIQFQLNWGKDESSELKVHWYFGFKFRLEMPIIATFHFFPSTCCSSGMSLFLQPTIASLYSFASSASIVANVFSFFAQCLLHCHFVQADLIRTICLRARFLIQWSMCRNC